MTLLQLLQSMNKREPVNNGDVEEMKEWLKSLPHEFKRAEAAEIMGVGPSATSRRLNQAQQMGLLRRRDVKASGACIVWQKVGKA